MPIALHAQTPPDSSTWTLFTVDSVLAISAGVATTPGPGGTVVLRDYQGYHFLDSTHSIHTVHRLVRIHSVTARDRQGNESLSFDGEHTRVLRSDARTVLPDGHTQSVAPQQFVVADEGEEEFSDRKTLSWPYPIVDSGVILEFLVVFETTREPGRGVFQRLWMNESDPLNLCEMDFRYPASWTVHEEHSAGVTYHTSKAGSERLSHWEARALKSTISEKSAPSVAEQMEWAAFGMTKSWSDEAAWYWHKVQPKIQSAAEVAAQAKAWTKDCRRREEKIAALFQHVAQAVRYVALSLGAGKLEPRMADTILATHYGDCKDKAVLLISLLQSVGIKALPACISSYDTTWFNPRFAEIGQFDHMIAFLPDDGARFVDPTCSDCRWTDLPFSDASSPALVLGADHPAGLMRVPAASDSAYTWHRWTRWVVDTSGARVSVNLLGKGYAAEIYKSDFVDADTADARKEVESMATPGLWGEPRLTRYTTTSDPDSGLMVRVFADYRTDSIFKSGSFNTNLGLGLEAINNWFTTVDTSARRLDIVHRIPKLLTHTVTIVPGPQWELQNERVSWELDTTWFSISSKVQTWPESSLVATALRMKPCRMTPQGYAEFLKALDMIGNRMRLQGYFFRRKVDFAKIKTLEEACRQRPDDASLMAALASCYLGADYGGVGCPGRERRQKARALFQQAYHNDPSNETAVTTAAALDVIDGRWLDADSLLRAYDSIRSSSLMVTSLLMSTSDKLGRYEQTLEYLKKLGSAATTPQVRAVFVEANAKVGNRKEAEAQLSLMETLGADKDMLNRTRITMLAALKRWNEADSVLAAWTGLKEVDRDLMRASLAGRRNDYPAALLLTRKILRINPDNPLYNNNLAWYLALCDSNLTEALAAVAKATTMNGPCDLSSRNTQAFILLKLGRIQEAQAGFEAALEDQSISSSTINNFCLGECARLRGNTEAARKYYTLASEANGDDDFAARARSALASLKSKAQE